MGENKHIEELDAFAKKYVKEIPTETPSVNFTANLMQKITELESTTITYKPLISKKMWFVIITAIIAVIIVPFTSSEEPIFTLPEFNLSFLEKMNLSGVFESINISNSVVFLAMIFSVFIFVQIVYLKNHFERQING